MKELAELFDSAANNPREDFLTKLPEDFSKKLSTKFSLKDSDFYKYDADSMPAGINSKKVKTELTKRLRSHYPSGLDFPSLIKNKPEIIRNFNDTRLSDEMNSILRSPNPSQSEKNLLLTYLWIRAVKQNRDINTTNVFLRPDDENITLLLEFVNALPGDDQVFREFFTTRKYESTKSLKELMASDSSNLSKDKFSLIERELPNFNNLFSEKKELLSYAAAFGRLEIVKSLINSGQVDAKLAGKELIAAAKNGHKEVVFEILRIDGIDVDKAYNKAFISAATNGHKELAADLKKSGKINFNQLNEGLILAVSGGDLKIVTNLLKIDEINVNHVDEDGDTALIIAVREGYLEIANKLLEIETIDVNKFDKYGNTALMLVADGGVDELEIANKLLERKGIDVNKVNKDGDTALIIAVRKGNSEIVEKILRIGVNNVDLANEDGDTALTLAAFEGHLIIVEQLLEIGGADVNMPNKYGRTALMEAAPKGLLKIAKKLLEIKTIDANKANKYGKTALMFVVDDDEYVNTGLDYNTALKSGKIKMIELLLESGKVDINKADKCGKTALMMAAEYGESDIIKTLLRYGADVAKVDKEGNTALMFAHEADEQIAASILNEAEEAAENKKRKYDDPSENEPSASPFANAHSAQQNRKMPRYEDADLPPPPPPIGGKNSPRHVDKKPKLEEEQPSTSVSCPVISINRDPNNIGSKSGGRDPS